jgi:hypothetical protein
MNDIERKRAQAIALAKARLRLKQKQQPTQQPAYDQQYASALESVVGPEVSNQMMPKPPEQIGLGGEIMQGIKDPFVGLGQGVANMAYGRNSPMSQQANELVAQDEQAYQARRKASGREGFDWGRTGGNIASTLPLAAISPGTTLPRMAASGGAVGGVAGGLQPVTDTSRDFTEQKMEQVGLGAGTGAVFAPLVGLVSRFVGGFKQTPEAERLIRQGVTPTTGARAGGIAQNLEDKAASVFPNIATQRRNAIQQFNKAAYDEVLAPIGQKYDGPIGQQAIGKIRNTLQGNYERILPKLRFAADEQFVDDLAGLRELAANLPTQKARQFENILKTRFASRVGREMTMDGKTLKQFESEMSKLLKSYGGARGDDGLLGDALQELVSSVDRAVRRVSDPQYADELANLDKAWALYHRVNDASVRAAGSADGVFTPNQLLQAIKKGDTTSGKWRVGSGQASMQGLASDAQNVLGNTYPDSGTAGRMLTAFGIGGGYALDPVIGGGLAAGTAMYTKPGQNLMNNLLYQRPDFARKFGEGLGRASLLPALGLAGSQ